MLGFGGLGLRTWVLGFRGRGLEEFGVQGLRVKRRRAWCLFEAGESLFDYSCE